MHNRFRDDNEPSEDYVRQLLDIPEKFGVLCIVTFGHKDEQRRPIDPARLEWEKVHIGKWQQKQAE